MRYLPQVLLFLGSLCVATAVAASDKAVKVAAVTGNKAGIKEVALMSNGELAITPTAGKTRYIQLSEDVSDRLLGRAEALSNVKVTTEKRNRICAMVPPPDLNFLNVSTSTRGDRFTGELVTTLTPADCSRRQISHPEDVYDHRLAELLRAEMAILGLALARE